MTITFKMPGKETKTLSDKKVDLNKVIDKVEAGGGTYKVSEQK